MNFDGNFLRALARLRDERRYRVFADLERIAGRYPCAVWHSPAGTRNIVIWCSNDYLAMARHPKVIKAMIMPCANCCFARSSSRPARSQLSKPSSRCSASADCRPPSEVTTAKRPILLRPSRLVPIRAILAWFLFGSSPIFAVPLSIKVESTVVSVT